MLIINGDACLRKTMAWTSSFSSYASQWSQTCNRDACSLLLLGIVCCSLVTICGMSLSWEEIVMCRTGSV
jgi:hypothetical protein